MEENNLFHYEMPLGLKIKAYIALILGVPFGLFGIWLIFVIYGFLSTVFYLTMVFLISGLLIKLLE